MGYAPGNSAWDAVTFFWFGFTCMIVIIALLALVIASPAGAATNFQQARFYWDHVPDNWTKSFRVECGTKPGNYTMFGETTGYIKSLGVGTVISKRDGTYYCAARNMNKADKIDPYGDLSNEKSFEVKGNWVYPK